ncbi:21019_t:CDS:2 [Rhizophagus irregularis]|nr:21019_t:CDS:2 [Rhizophagus irregularis]
MFRNPLSDHEVPDNILQFQTPIICDYFQKTPNEELILVPNNYQVETVLNGLTVLCKTQYQFSRKIVVRYTVEWTDENGQIRSSYSLSSAGAAVSGTTLFGLDTSFLQQIREIIASQPQQIPANRKRCFTELTSQSQKNKRISMIGKEIATQTLTILKENKFTSSSEEIIASLEAIILKINDFQLPSTKSLTSTLNSKRIEPQRRCISGSLYTRSFQQKVTS